MKGRWRDVDGADERDASRVETICQHREKQKVSILHWSVIRQFTQFIDVENERVFTFPFLQLKGSSFFSFTFCKYFCNQRWIDADIENCVRIFSVCTLDDDGYKLSWILIISFYSKSNGYQLRTFSDTRTDISGHVSTKPIRSSFLNEATILWGKKFLLTFPYIAVDHTQRLHI